MSSREILYLSKAAEIFRRLQNWLIAFGDSAVYGFLCTVSLLYAQIADRERLWVDERITRELIQRWDTWEILTVLPLYQPHYPTYYLLPELAGWGVTGFISAVSLPITTYATIRAALALYGRFEAAYIAGAFVAVSPFLATQATWIRMYSPLTALLTVGLWLGLESRYRTAAPFMLLGGLLHVFGVFGVLWLALIASFDREYAVGAVTAVLGVLPTVTLLLINTGKQGVTQQSTGMGHGIAPSLVKVLVTPGAALVGSPHLLLEVVGILAVTALVVYPALDRRLYAWMLLPIIAIPMASHLVHPVFRLKYFGFVAPAVALAIANPERRWWHWGLIVMLTSGLVLLSWTQRMTPAIVSRRIIFWF